MQNYTGMIKGRNQRFVADEACKACQAKGVEISYSMYRHNVLFSSVSSLEALVSVLDDAAKYYISIKKKAMAVAAENVRSIIVDEVVLHGGSIPKEIRGGRIYCDFTI